MRHFYTVAVAGLVGLLPYLAAAQASPVVADSLAQDTVASYLVAVDERWVRSQVDSTGECTEILHWSGPGGLVRVFHPSGRLKQHIPYANFAAGRLHGVVTTWYDDGQMEALQTFIRGRRDGQLLLYYPNGQLKRKTNYESGSELLGDCFNAEGERIAYFPYEQPPLYPGGQLQLTKEISGALRGVRLAGPAYLSSAQIHVRFQVDEHGSIANPQVTFSDEKFSLMLGGQPSASSWQVAMEQTVAPLVSRVQRALAQLTKAFYPGQRDGAAVRWQYNLTIPFDTGGLPPRTGSIRRRGTNFEP